MTASIEPQVVDANGRTNLRFDYDLPRSCGCSLMVNPFSPWITISRNGCLVNIGASNILYDVLPNNGPRRTASVVVIPFPGTCTGGGTQDVVQSGPLSNVNGASFSQSIAQESIASAFGAELATTTQSATTTPLPTVLGGISVTVGDRRAPLFFVSPDQVNYQVPPGLPPGEHTVTIARDSGPLIDRPRALAQKRIVAVAPGIFTVTANGRGLASGQWLRYSGQTLVDSGELTTPIRFGTANETVFLVLYGTGFRFAGLPSVVVGNSLATVTFAGAHPTLVGLDQLNAILPRNLSGAGQVRVSVTANGVPANAVTITAGP